MNFVGLHTHLASYPVHQRRGKSGLVPIAHACVNISGIFTVKLSVYHSWNTWSCHRKEYGWNIQQTKGLSQNECCCMPMVTIIGTSIIALTYPFGNKAVVFVFKKVTNIVILSQSCWCWQMRANEPPNMGLILIPLYTSGMMISLYHCL